MKYTKGTLKKLNFLFTETGYQIRYEKGRFHSGYCILEEKKVVVINKFLDIEGQINALLDILPKLNIKYNKLNSELQDFVKKIIQPALRQNKQGKQLKIKFEEGE